MRYCMSRKLEMPMDKARAAAEEGLAAEGFGILTEIDVQDTLKQKLDVDHPPYRILGACNPAYAYEALQSEPQVGTMLPCNVILREISDGVVEISAIDPTASMQAIGNPELAGVARTIRNKLDKVIASL